MAVQQLDGVFKVRELHEATGIGRDVILDLAKRWELCGWLTPIQTNDKGHRIGRGVTSTLADLAGTKEDANANMTSNAHANTAETRELASTLANKGIR